MYITKSRYQYLMDCEEQVRNGRVLDEDGLRMICEAYNYAPKAIGGHFIGVLAEMIMANENATRIICPAAKGEPGEPGESESDTIDNEKQSEDEK